MNCNLKHPKLSKLKLLICLMALILLNLFYASVSHAGGNIVCSKTFAKTSDLTSCDFKLPDTSLNHNFSISVTSEYYCPQIFNPFSTTKANVFIYVNTENDTRTLRSSKKEFTDGLYNTVDSNVTRLDFKSSIVQKLSVKTGVDFGYFKDFKLNCPGKISVILVLPTTVQCDKKFTLITSSQLTSCIFVLGKTANSIIADSTLHCTDYYTKAVKKPILRIKVGSDKYFEKGYSLNSNTLNSQLAVGFRSNDGSPQTILANIDFQGSTNVMCKGSITVKTIPKH